MAVTINAQPTADTLNSAYRPIEYEVVSTSPDIVKMKCFIYLDGSGTADNATSAIIIDPDFGTTDTFTFDISGYLRGLDSLTNDIQTAGSTVSVTSAPNSAKSVKVTFTEIDLDSSTGLLIDGDSTALVDSNSIYAINGVWQYDQVATKLADFEIATTGSRYFLTNNRNTRSIGSSDTEYLSFFTNLSGSEYLRVATYTGANATGTETVRYLAITLAAGRKDIPVGTANISSTSGWVDNFGNPAPSPSFTGSVKSYSVRMCSITLFPTVTNILSETIVYNVDYSCDNEHTRFAFLNRLGAFEYFTFRGYRNRSISIRKQYYKDVLTSGYSIGDGGDRALNIDSRNEFVVFSQPLKDADRIWLEELLEGLEVFVIEGNNYIPVKVRAGGTNIVDEQNNLMEFKMTYQYSNPNWRQNG